MALLHDHICQALSDPRRIQIMYALNESRRHVSAIADALGIPQPAVSRHLAVLAPARAGLGRARGCRSVLLLGGSAHHSNPGHDAPAPARHHGSPGRVSRQPGVTRPVASKPHAFCLYDIHPIRWVPNDNVLLPRRGLKWGYAVL
ncbi:MAG: winged helix-turn-helix transcriptional regulator [Chloroflexi bacterium]|nr:winged helix-turn-helix transcriptional regulator [Chloroflexota bacterium]